MQLLRPPISGKRATPLVSGTLASLMGRVPLAGVNFTGIEDGP
jgi:hypothetical protein